MPATSKVGMSFLDYSGETGKIDFYLPQVNAGNIVAELADALPATVGSLAEAICALSDCTCIVSSVEAANSAFTKTLPASAFAQRELGLLVTYQDTVSKKNYRITIPGPKWTTIGQANSDLVDPADALWTAFVAKFEANALSPEGNAVTVTGGRLVGRNR